MLVAINLFYIRSIAGRFANTIIAFTHISASDPFGNMTLLRENSFTKLPALFFVTSRPLTSFCFLFFLGTYDVPVRRKKLFIASKKRNESFGD